MGLGTWLSLILGVLKLLGSLASFAQESRQRSETDAAALGRILNDAQDTIAAARKARADSARRDAAPGGLRQSDGFRRD